MCDILKATHTGKLLLGETEIPCAVLENGQRILSEKGITTALKSRSGSSRRTKKKYDSGRGPFAYVFGLKKHYCVYF